MMLIQAQQIHSQRSERKLRTISYLLGLQLAVQIGYVIRDLDLMRAIFALYAKLKALRGQLLPKIGLLLDPL